MDRSRLSRFVNQPLSELPLEEPAVVSPFITVRTAVTAMQQGSRSCVIAVEAGEVVGIFTEGDVVRRCMADGFDWDQPLADSVMTRNPRTIASDRSIADAVLEMQEHQHRMLPVLTGGAVVGLVRLGELIRHLAEAYPEDVLNLPPHLHQVMERPEGG
ncbi:MAG: CBS domain-containing protein [Dehalococcoidia bacterium]|nr:CBS domain-containing protein [Dehalococcoidia bacterium]